MAVSKKQAFFRSLLGFLQRVDNIKQPVEVLPEHLEHAGQAEYDWRFSH